MKKLVPKKTYYELLEKLGEGVTSEVYRAFRVDQKAWTRQQVALKIIKSEKDVQILKKEFVKLLKVDSKFCVHVKAWENLSKGPALVLEYIEGVTLYELTNSHKLSSDLVAELICQISMGLRALHRSEVIHGDLNLKNILINTDGIVKLIDFGFFGVEKRLLTPEFASPEVLSGGLPQFKSDFYSLRKIQNKLLQICELSSCPPVSTSRGVNRRALGRLVQSSRKQKLATTQVLTSVEQRRLMFPIGPLLIGAFSFVITMSTPLLFIESPSFGRFVVKSRRWVGVSLNGMPEIYSPISMKKLRKGRYQLSWQTSEASKVGAIEIKKNQTFMLNPR